MTNLKLCILMLVCCLFSNTTLQAQKAKFKSKLCTVQKTRLPVNYTEPEKRTYDLYTKGSYATNIDPHDKKVFGWTNDQDRPNLKGVVSIYGFTMGKPSKKSEKKQKKNKEGKVTERWTQYSYSASATGKGTLYIYGLSNPFKYNKKEEEKSKYERKKEAKKEAAKKDMEDNPFLTAEDISDAEESDVSVDEGLPEENLELVKTVNVNQVKRVETGRTHRSTKNAYKEFTEKQRPLLYDFKSAYPEAAYKQAISQLNYLYGYTPVNNRFYLKRMKTDKHPEFQIWNDACQATETLLKTVKYNKPIDAIQGKFEPIISYFGKQVDNIADKDKKAKKMKKAAFQNLINILFYLDKHDELIAWCEKAANSKHLSKSAKKMLRRTNQQKAQLAFHKMTTCHIDSVEEAELEDIETEEVEEEEEIND